MSQVRFSVPRLDIVDLPGGYRKPIWRPAYATIQQAGPARPIRRKAAKPQRKARA